MDFVVKDLERYRQAVKRAKAMGFPQYVEPLERIVIEMERIVRIDDDLLRDRFTLSLFE